MSTAPSSLCDGCGRAASDAHIARRIRRIELASRFRPIHIHTLVVAEAPPANPEEYFYDPAGAGRFREELLAAADVAAGAAEQRLGEFQRRGLFLAEAVECPLEEIAGEPVKLVEAAAGVLAQRIARSYRPRRVLPLTARLAAALAPQLERAGLAALLLPAAATDAELAARLRDAFEAL